MKPIGLAGELGEPDQPLVQELAQLPGEIVGFRLAERLEAPVAAPGVVEHVADVLHLLAVAREVERPHDQPLRQRPREHAADGGRKLGRGVVEIGKEILLLDVALLFQPGADVRGSWPISSIGGVSKPRTSTPSASLVERLKGPLRRRMPRATSHASAVPSKAANTARVVLRGEHAEMADRLGPGADPVGADPADVAAVPAGQPVLRGPRAGNTDCAAPTAAAAVPGAAARHRRDRRG